MKLQLDTTEKIIRIEESVNLGELIATLNKLLPESTWERFTLEIGQKIVWSNPIVVIKDYRPSYPYPWYDPLTPTITCDTATLQSGNYCVDVW